MYQNDGSFAEGYAIGRDSGNYNNNGFGNGWEGLIGLALVASLFGGWGGGFGFGNGRNNGFTGGDLYGWQLGKLATTNDVASGFSTAEIMSDLNSIILGQAQMQNFINQGFSGLSNQLIGEFRNIDNAVCTLGYQNQAGFNAIANQIASCCCDLKTMNLENRYLNEKQTCDIVNAINVGNQRLVDIYTNDKIEALRAENVALKGQISNDKQTANIVSQLRDPGCPVASYVVPNPNCCYNPFGFNFNNGCSGCNF